MLLKDRFRGCLVGLACGDAAGYPVEFIMNLDDIRAIHGPQGVTGLPNPALYSDDTQMTLCIAEALAEAGDDPGAFSECLAKNFVKWFQEQQDPKMARGPGNTCLAACERLAMGESPDKSGIEASMGCGSAMRSAPIGLYHWNNTISIVEYGIASSMPTHSNPVALCGAVANALLTALALNDVPVGVWALELQTISRGISKQFEEAINLAAAAAGSNLKPSTVLSNKCLGEGWTADEAIASALYCCMLFPNDYKKAVLCAANTVGDSDSIACITGGWMGAKLGISAIPEEWVKGVENSDKLLDLADRLYGRCINRGTALKQEEKAHDEEGTPQVS